jgi:glutamate-1-semialdehyde 2,1-aminomutase
MIKRDYKRLIKELHEEFSAKFPLSASINKTAKKYLVDGGSHTLRLFQPFPLRIESAKGAWLKDEDGHDILDFWQGHLANILGYNPSIITEEISEGFKRGVGLQLGITDKLQLETAEILCRQTGAERVRFTTSGSLATMYSCFLSRSYTGRDLIMKVGGGWHGCQPWGLKGIKYHSDSADHYNYVDSEGIPKTVMDNTLITRFNDTNMLADQFKKHGEKIACLIVEPFLGSGGLIPASKEYLQSCRELTERNGAVLILDEVISGFRFRAGNLGKLYGIQPDLATFGKIMGGGMPVAAVAGIKDIMNLVGIEEKNRVKFSGGTYSAHPASLLAAKTMMTYLVDNEKKIYPRLAVMGENTRKAMEGGFLEQGIFARCTGYGNDVIPGSSMATLHFPYNEDVSMEDPEIIFDPSVCDVTLERDIVTLALILENVHIMKGHGAVSTAHTDEDISFVSRACQQVARRIKPYL